MFWKLSNLQKSVETSVMTTYRLLTQIHQLVTFCHICFIFLFVIYVDTHTQKSFFSFFF